MKKTSKLLFLDDVRNVEDAFSYTGMDIYTKVPDLWDVVRNFNDFVKYIENKGIPQLISFDHDLAPEHYRESMYAEDKRYNKYYTDGTFKEKTGYDCAKWLVDYCTNNNAKIPIVTCHSMNPIGKENILKVLNEGKSRLNK